ncbi:MAG: GtrA family protein [Bacillales bacterium]|jgi:putative flippase GtrA|nr:GtrA family protein [Bacillales bacterium]
MSQSFLKFLVVGVINTIIGMGSIYFMLHILSFGYWPATFIGNSIGATVSYLLNRNFTFKSDHAHFGAIFRFVIVIGLCYFIAYYLGVKFVHTFLSGLPFEEDIAVLIGAGSYTILNYFGQKWFVFSKSRYTPKLKELRY